MDSIQISYYLSTYSQIAARSKEISDQMNHLLAIKAQQEKMELEEVELIEADLFTLLQAQHYNMQALEGIMLNRKEAQQIKEGISQEQIALASLQGVTLPAVETIVAPVQESLEIEQETPQEPKEETMAELLEQEEKNAPKEPETNYPMKDGERIFRFSRRLVGGYVEMPGMETNVDGSPNYFVPEKMVLDMKVEDGDFLFVKNKYNKDGFMRYNFEIAERNDDQTSNRMSYEFCHVREDVSPIAPSNFYVERSYTQGAFVGLKNNSYYEIDRLYLTEGDIEYRNIQENDIIKVVYWANAPQETLRIVEVSDLPGGEDRPKLESKPTKKVITKKELPEVDMNLYPELNGRSIVVVGFEPFHNRYESLLTRHGAEPTLYTGDETLHTISSTIENADIVVFVVEMMSHNAYSTFKEHAKLHNVRHVLATKSGANFIAHLANATLAASAES